MSLQHSEDIKNAPLISQPSFNSAQLWAEAVVQSSKSDLLQVWFVMSKKHTEEDGGHQGNQNSMEMLFPVNLDSTGRRLEHGPTELVPFPTPSPGSSSLVNPTDASLETPITPTEAISSRSKGFNTLEWPKPIITPPPTARTVPEVPDSSTRSLALETHNRRHCRSVSDTGPLRPQYESDAYTTLAGDVNGINEQSHHRYHYRHLPEMVYPIQPFSSRIRTTISSHPLVRSSSSGYTELDFVPLSMAHKPPHTPFSQTDSVLPPSSSSFLHPDPYYHLVPYPMDTSLVPLEPLPQTLRPENLGVLLISPPSINIQNPIPIAVHGSRVRFEEALMESSRKKNRLSTLTVQRKSDRYRRWSWGGKSTSSKDHEVPLDRRSGSREEAKYERPKL